MTYEKIIDYSETDSLDIFIKSRKYSCSCPQCKTENCHLHEIYEYTSYNHIQ